MTLIPMNKAILIKDVNEENTEVKTQSGIYLAPTTSKTSWIATVLAVAECKETEGVRVGDTVVVANKPIVFYFEGESYAYIMPEWIVAKVSK